MRRECSRRAAASRSPRLLLNRVGVPNAAERQSKELPGSPLSLERLGHCELRRHLVAADHRVQRDAAPDKSRVIEYLDGDVVDIGLLVPDAAGSDDFELLRLLPRSAHVQE